VAAWGPSASKVIFIGDGVSDLPIAREGGADVIFAKQGRALARVCAESGVEHTVFDGFGEVRRAMEGLGFLAAGTGQAAPGKL